MIRTLRITGIVAALVVLTAGASAREPLTLSDEQLDTVTAGSYATGSGDGIAFGLIANSTITLLTNAEAGWMAPISASAYGRVSSNASSPDFTASTASTLLLSVFFY